MYNCTSDKFPGSILIQLTLEITYLSSNYMLFLFIAFAENKKVPALFQL